MLSTRHKADILRKAGLQVPACPTDAEAVEAALSTWAKAVEILYVTYAAARAAKSLRDAEEVRQIDMLRRLSASRATA